MRIEPIQHKFGKPKPKPISFGIYIKTNITSFGKCTYGKYRGNNIEIYEVPKDKTKLYYISDKNRRWIQSKLVYFINGIKKIARSYTNGM